MKGEKEQLISILEALLEEKIDVLQAQDQIEALTIAEFGEIYGNLFHYLLDEDLRAKDVEYKEFQDTEMKKLINHLRNGNIELAGNVSFLHVS